MFLEQLLNCLNAYFGFDCHSTSLSHEVIAGLTNLYYHVLHCVSYPCYPVDRGIPEGPSFVATVLVAVAGCYLMAAYVALLRRESVSFIFRYCSPSTV